MQGWDAHLQGLAHAHEVGSEPEKLIGVHIYQKVERIALHVPAAGRRRRTSFTHTTSHRRGPTSDTGCSSAYAAWFTSRCQLWE